MYERFTDRARKVMQLANQEAQRFNHEYIGTEHILLGLVAEGSGVAANVLKNLNISLPEVRRQIYLIVQHVAGDAPQPTERRPQTPRAKKVIEYAIEEARTLNHNYVGTEHLLLGLLREEQGVAAQVLLNLGLKLEDVRQEVLNLLGHNIPDTAPDHPRDEVFHIPKSLNPWTTETYPLGELWDESSAASGPDATKAGTDSTAPPDLTPDQRRIIRARIRRLSARKAEFIKGLDFDRAAKCGDEADALARLLALYEWFNNRP